MSFLTDFQRAFGNEYGIGSEENRAVMFEARKRKGQQPDAPKMQQMVGSYRLPQVLNAIRGGQGDPDYVAARKKAGVDIMNETLGQRVGSGVGAAAADLTQDATRRFWWLLNAAQAVGEVGAEQAMVAANPDLYKSEVVGKGKNAKKIPKYKPGLVAALSIPSGIAINTGLGLMTPFGGAEGYKAALPSDEDPSKTSNIIGEIGAKYFLGRTGNLLPYDEFVKVRPDVSPEEYGRYKAFKFDKEGDLNPFDDGQITVPTGVLKATTEGIHGPEVQFLGRSLPVTTGIIPYASAVAGGALGVRTGRPIRDGLIGGVGGLTVGNIVGNIIEQERRRRNTVENELNGTLS